jgi:AAA domain
MTEARQLARLAVATPPDGFETQPPSLFRRYSAAELAEPVGNLEFLVNGLLAHPTYGQIAGPHKTMKTHAAMAIGLGVASGEPVMDFFDVPERRPVVYYSGEGGQKPYQRRLQRMAESANVDLKSLDFEAVFDVAPIQSAVFQQSLARDLRELRPGLVIIDPYYAFHGGASNAANLYEEGQMLAGLSNLCLTNGSSLLLVNHFNQTGKGNGLNRITMAGSAEWVDSWVLLGHRDKPTANVEAGEFFLKMRVGSRQWGGRDLDVDLQTGPFDHRTGVHEGRISWHVQSPLPGERDLNTLLKLLRDEPFQHTKAGLTKRLGGNAQNARALIDRLETAAVIMQLPLRVPEGDREVTRNVYALAEPRPPKET